MGACGVNNTDLWTREGAYGRGHEAAWMGPAFHFPRIQGLDAVGHIVAVGESGDATRIGQRVLVNPCLYAGDHDGLAGLQVVGSERDGGFAQFLCVPSANALPIHSEHSDAELATFMTPYMTAEHMLRRAGLRAGERIFITGASGGVGSALVQLALLRGAEVVALSSRAKVAAIDQAAAHRVLAGADHLRDVLVARQGELAFELRFVQALLDLELEGVGRQKRGRRQTVQGRGGGDDDHVGVALPAVAEDAPQRGQALRDRSTPPVVCPRRRT